MPGSRRYPGGIRAGIPARNWPPGIPLAPRITALNRKPLMQLAVSPSILFYFSIHTVGTLHQEDEIQLEINILEDHNEDTKDQPEVEIKPFSGNLER